VPKSYRFGVVGEKGRSGENRDARTQQQCKKQHSNVSHRHLFHRNLRTGSEKRAEQRIYAEAGLAGPASVHDTSPPAVRRAMLLFGHAD
jgi:hypothetical protein